MKNIGNEYSKGGMTIATILGLIGFFILYFTKIFDIRTYEQFYQYIIDYGMILIFSLFFIIISLYCWLLYIRNVVIKPKNEVLYLIQIEDNICKFINNRGKTYFYENNNYELDKYYNVLKTKDSIVEIKDKSIVQFQIPKEKKSYWLNFYTPMGNFENIMILPIAYVIALPGVLSILISKGTDKIYGIIFSFIPIFIIIYDLIYKIKLNKNDGQYIDDTKLRKSFDTLMNSIKIVPLIIANIVLITIFFRMRDITSKIILIPFIICFISVFFYVLGSILNKDIIVKLMKKIYVIGFLTFWIGFLIFFSYSIIKQENDNSMLLFTIPFWIFAIILIYKEFIKK